MKPNKSIDGLTIRDASTKASPIPTKSKDVFSRPTKVVKKAAIQKTVKKAEPKKPTEKLVLKPTPKPVTPEKIPEKKPEPTINTREQAVEDFLKPVQAFDFDGTTGELKASEKSNNKEEFNIKTKTKEKSKFKLEKKKLDSEPNPKKPSKKRRIIASIALVIVLILIGLVSWAVFWGNDIIAKITGGQGNVLDLMKFVEPTYDPLKTDANGRTNILAFGTSGYDMSGDEGDGVHAGAQLTDSIMVISLNQETGDIAMLSLPRDLKASPTCTATGKINEVYWCNGGGYDIPTEQEATAANALMAEVGSILGIDFQYFAHLNWGSLITVVDLVDGIEVTLDEDINDEWWTGAVYQAGVTYRLNGEEALGLARARHGTAGGDFSRGASQQKILIGIKNKFMAKDNFSITDILTLASTLGDNFRSNFSIDELKSLAHLGFDFDFENMRQISLWPDFMTTGTLDNGISYVFPRAGVNVYDTIRDFVATNLSNDPRVYETPIIAILNATGETGVASTETIKLQEAGYQITTTDNAPVGYTTKDKVTIYYNNNKPGTKSMLEKQYSEAVFTSIAEAPEGINQNYDFVIVVGPTPEPTTEAETPEATE